jgi:hypothetical protein
MYGDDVLGRHGGSSRKRWTRLQWGSASLVKTSGPPVQAQLGRSSLTEREYMKSTNKVTVDKETLKGIDATVRCALRV